MNTTQQDSHGGDDFEQLVRMSVYQPMRPQDSSIGSDPAVARHMQDYDEQKVQRILDYAEQLATQRVHEARLNELKHRADDIINRMYRLDRKYADNYLFELTAELKGHAK